MEGSVKEREGARPRALDAATICEAFQLTVEDHPERVAIRTQDDSVSLTWAEYGQRAREVAAGLAALGVEKGDTVGVMLTNRPEFHFCDAGAMHLGACPYSIYNTYSPEQIEHLVEDAGNTVLITEQAFAERVLEVQGKDNALEHVVVIDGDTPDDAISLDELIAKGEDDFDFDAAWKAVEPGDLLTLIYTSGTTGHPKGVQLTHDNLASCVRSYDEIIDFPGDGRVISWLPMAHIAERNCSQYLPIMLGFTTTDCPNAKEVMGYVAQVHPTWFFAVPRIWEKLKSFIETGVENEQDEAKKAGTQKAFAVALKRVEAIQAGEEVPEELEQAYQQADEQVFSKVRALIGLDQVESVNVGAAPTPPEVIKFFHALGIPLAELWGMSETTGAGTCNPPEKIKIGTVGPPAPGVDIKLAEDGEVLIKGPIIMSGYRNLPDKTDETLTDDGWLMTGDIGEFDDDGYLKIVDRKKELIINAAGKNMSPANIESVVKSASPLIGQVAAIGDQRSYNVALITLDPDAAGDKDPSDPDVEKAVADAVEEANQKLARVEQIKKFKLLHEEWQPGGDELTPTMKLKRKPIAEKYSEEIESLYSG
ncbi:MAG: long-chain fatty acid--CoA ligase [Thermoleophilaceae bacterium]|nr:long-chain fatty acid--CoA ligase [Thermoleophilaceae bacterium]